MRSRPISATRRRAPITLIHADTLGDLSGGETRANCDRVAAPPSRPLSLSPLSPAAVGRTRPDESRHWGLDPIAPIPPIRRRRNGANLGEGEGEEMRVYDRDRTSRSLYACVAYSVPAERARDRELRYYSQRT